MIFLLIILIMKQQILGMRGYNTMDFRDLMTVGQVAEMFNYSQNSIQKNFKKTAAAIKKKYNIDLVKCKTLEGVRYQIFEDSDKRALTIYQETEDIFITLESLSYKEYEFYIFLAIAASPFGVFRGKREDLLKYVGIKSNKGNIQILNEVLNNLVKKECIYYQEDKDYIIAYLRANLENKYPIKINMLRQSQRIANQNNKNFNKVLQLVKVWEAIRICYQNQPFTYAEISRITGLSYKQIRDVKKLLESNNMFKTSRAGSYFLCEGMKVDLNAFIN